MARKGPSRAAKSKQRAVTPDEGGSDDFSTTLSSARQGNTYNLSSSHEASSLDDSIDSHSTTLVSPANQDDEDDFVDDPTDGDVKDSMELLLEQDDGYLMKLLGLDNAAGSDLDSD
jgi:hypothetical protein